jgi:acyl carrier protein
MNTFQELNAIFCRVFDDDDIQITPEYTMDDIEGWDSLSHMNLVVTIEKHFGVKFPGREIYKWKNAGEMLHSLDQLLQQKT